MTRQRGDNKVGYQRSPTRGTMAALGRRERAPVGHIYVATVSVPMHRSSVLGPARHQVVPSRYCPPSPYDSINLTSPRIMYQRDDCSSIRTRRVVGAPAICVRWPVPRSAALGEVQTVQKLVVRGAERVTTLYRVVAGIIGNVQKVSGEATREVATCGCQHRVRSQQERSGRRSARDLTPLDFSAKGRLTVPFSSKRLQALAAYSKKPPRPGIRQRHW